MEAFSFVNLRRAWSPVDREFFAEIIDVAFARDADVDKIVTAVIETCVFLVVSAFVKTRKAMIADVTLHQCVISGDVFARVCELIHGSLVAVDLNTYVRIRDYIATIHVTNSSGMLKVVRGNRSERLSVSDFAKTRRMFAPRDDDVAL